MVDPRHGKLISKKGYVYGPKGERMIKEVEDRVDKLMRELEEFLARGEKEYETGVRCRTCGYKDPEDRPMSKCPSCDEAQKAVAVKKKPRRKKKEK